MAKSKLKVFKDTLAALANAKAGQEASMYPHVRDLLVEALGYSRTDILVDVHGEGGRPDLVAKARAGLADNAADDLLIDWIVVEVKDEHDAFTTLKKREAVFAKKAKYIGPDTEWFFMVDPTAIVARPVRTARLTATDDIHLPISDSVTLTEFQETFADLRREVAGVSNAMIRFRAGDDDLIATEKLLSSSEADRREVNQVELNQRNFFTTLRTTTAALQRACERALNKLEPQLTEIADQEAAFAHEFGPGVTIVDSPLSLRGQPQNAEQSQKHEIEAGKLRRSFAKRPVLARLELVGLRDFSRRKNVKTRPETIKLFGIETANLILARILLIRFLEDHGFFGDRKYVCNGGVAGFQSMKEYFGQGYTKLLEQAYAKAGGLYAAAFDRTELDWIFAVDDDELSRSVEWVMYQLSKYDFTTVRGDILTGIYDRFLDKATRKKYGEYYTPPSIARFILDELALATDDRILDPACGSGTFLIERLEQIVGEPATKGVAVFEDAQNAVDSIVGADQNTFSAVLAQIQILWHLLIFKDDIRAHGFPDVLISEGADSVAAPLLSHERHGLFSEVDRPAYAAIVGNPPYIRPERAPKPSQATEQYYEALKQGPNDEAWNGISASLNIFGLFIYRALSSWCRNEGAADAGKVGFVVPLSFCGANEFAELRKLFAPGGRWTLLEVVDLEAVWSSVFDADVLPMIIFAQARPPLGSDRVRVRVADAGCVSVEGGRNAFDLSKAPFTELDYGDVFSEDFRVLTRMTPARRRILDKIGSKERLSDAARRYWVKRVGADRHTSIATEPTIDRVLWDERQMIHGGVTFRGDSPPESAAGLPVYKGENIVTSGLVGVPARHNVDVTALKDPSVWRNPSILPDEGWAIPVIYTCPTAVRFKPTETAFDNTVTLVFFDDKNSSFPLDIFFASRIVTFYYVLSCRMSFLNKARSHLYPTNVRLLPWASSLVGISEELEDLGDELARASALVHAREDAVRAELDKLDYVTFKSAVLDHHAGKLDWSAGLSTSDERVLVTEADVVPSDDGWRIMLNGTEWVAVPDEALAARAALGFSRHLGKEVGRAQILNSGIPASEGVAQKFGEVQSKFVSTDGSEVETALDKIDALVAPHFGLDVADVAAIKADMSADPLLSQVRPRMPHSTTRLRGLRAGLDSSTRYQ